MGFQWIWTEVRRAWISPVTTLITAYAVNDPTKAVANGTGGTPAEPDKSLPKATGSLPIKELLDRLLALVPMGLADQARDWRGRSSRRYNKSRTQ